MTLADELAARIDREGPLTVADYVAACLYDPRHGFYASGGRAGRRGDFLTAPEVGPLFGAVLA
ncbi:MAG: class I SAM-dependent methyltransferase, partial [Actinomyces sp.]